MCPACSRRKESGNVVPKHEFNDLINNIPVILAKDVNLEILALLEYEADVVSILDFRKSPLSAFVYKSIGQEKMLNYLVFAKEFFIGKRSAEDFLNELDQGIVSTIATVCAEMISTRRNRFLSLCSPKSKKRTVA